MSLMPAAVQAPALPCRAAQRNIQANRSPTRVARASLFRRAPPPPPPFWQQPQTWAIVAVAVGLALGVRYLYRRSKKNQATPKMSMAEMYFRLEKSALAGTVASETTSASTTSETTAPSKPLPATAKPPTPVAMPPPTAPTSTAPSSKKTVEEKAPEKSAKPTPAPPATTPPPAATTPPPPAATTPPPAATTPPPPAATTPPPAATTPPPPPAATTPPPAATTPPPPAATTPPPAATPSAASKESKPPPAAESASSSPPKESKDAKADEKSSAEAKEKKGFGWLLNRNKTEEAQKLAELLQGEDESPVKFLRAVASELCLDTPGFFDGTEGLTVVPDSVPAKSILLHAAVKAEAEKLQPKEAAEGTVKVAQSMIRELVEKAAAVKDSKGKRDVLDKVVLLASNSQSLTSTITPDVEAGIPVYAGSLRYKTLEALFDVYLDKSVVDMQETSVAMLGSLMSGQDASEKQVAEIEARATEAEKAQNTLASVFKISEGKAQKLLEKKMKAAQDQVQKDLMSNLMNGNS